jgi:hypothetical protein
LMMIKVIKFSQLRPDFLFNIHSQVDEKYIKDAESSIAVIKQVNYDYLKSRHPLDQPIYGCLMEIVMCDLD